MCQKVESVNKMDDRKQKYLTLLNKKLDALTKILEATGMPNFFGEGDEEYLQQEAERFTTLYENREEFIAQIQEIDKSLASFMGAGEADDELAKIGKPVVDKIMETAKAVVELDKKHIAASEKIAAFLKGNLKQIRDGRDVSSAYTDASASTSGNYFDKTN